MRKHLTIRWVIASDAACIIGGFLAGIVAIHLLQSAPFPDPTGSLRQIVQPSTEGVHRAGKADRGNLVPFAERFGATVGVAPNETMPATPADRSGRVPPQIEPAANTITTVPKGAVPPPARSTDKSAERPRGARPEPSPLKAVGCEPLASPLVEPSLARFVGRCLT